MAISPYCFTNRLTHARLPCSARNKQDIIIIVFSSIARFFRLKRSQSDRYSRVNGTDASAQRGGIIGAIGGRGGGEGRGHRADVDAENRLIDQLDEEWED